MGKLIDVDAESFGKFLRSPEIGKRLQAGRAGEDRGLRSADILVNGMKIEQAPRLLRGFDALIMDELKKLKLRRTQGR